MSIPIATVLIAERLGEICLKACLDWGKAINEYEAMSNDSPDKAQKLEQVQLCGGYVQQLSKQLASRLKPEKGI